VTHQRSLIRAAMVAALMGETSAEDRVFSERVIPYKRNELPILAVYTVGEDVDAGSLATSPRELTRQLHVAIEGWVAPGSDGAVEDVLDSLAAEVEAAIHADPYLGGLCADLVLEGTEPDIGREGDRLMGLIVLTYRVTYRTLAPDVDNSNLDDFLRVDAQHALRVADESQATAEDQFTVQETES
jgi:hypothetical protein